MVTPDAVLPSVLPRTDLMREFLDYAESLKADRPDDWDACVDLVLNVLAHAPTEPLTEFEVEDWSSSEAVRGFIERFLRLRDSEKEVYCEGIFLQATGMRYDQAMNEATQVAKKMLGTDARD